MIGEALIFGGSSNAAVAVMALIFAAIFAWFAWDSYDAGDAYDGRVAAWLGAAHVTGAGVSAALA